ncbi:MAG: hypothetical protein II951_07075 [Bacteroidales bacterium]|nr:hypothetical protein [Bacteroidales bacterium]
MEAGTMGEKREVGRERGGRERRDGGRTGRKGGEKGRREEGRDGNEAGRGEKKDFRYILQKKLAERK